MSLFLVTLPLALGIFVIGILGLVERTRFPVRGISPSYFASVALLFGLFASLVATDAWQRTNKATLSLATEVSSLRAILRIAEVELKDTAAIHAAVKNYVNEVRTRELTNNPKVDTLAPPPSGLHQLYKIGAATNAFSGNTAVSISYMSALETVRASRLQRLELVKNHIPDRNFAILFLMGFLTQMAIGFSHSGNRSAMTYSVMLFSIAFSGAIYFIMTFDNPYSTGYGSSMLELAEVF